MSSLKDIMAGFCGSCTSNPSVFRNAFERAEQGIVNPPPSAPPSVGIYAEPKNEF